MKFEWFEILKYLEQHTKNNDEFNRKLRALTQQDAMKLWAELKSDRAGEMDERTHPAKGIPAPIQAGSSTGA